MNQPVLGSVSLIGVVAISLGIISLFDEQTFNTWVTFLVICIVPMQLVMVMVWGGSYPEAIRNMRQPRKGMAMTLITVGVGLPVALFSYYGVGKGHGVSPVLIMYIIFTVVVAFWFIVLWRCWPITLFSRDPRVLGAGALLVSYFGGYLLFDLLFAFSFLEGSPGYYADADPGGLFPAWTALIIGVSSVAMIMVMTLFDDWPVQAIKNETGRNIVSSSIVFVLGALMYYVWTETMNMEQIRYMVLVPVSFIFGTFVPLTFFRGTLLNGMAQPWKGVALTGLCCIAAVVLQRIYLYMGPYVSGPLASGPKGNYQEEIWLANALLGLTFPLLVIMLEYFQFWPLARSRGDEGG